MPRTMPKPSLLSPAPGFLVLRVNGGPRDGQVVRLKSAKCTIGSSASCTLRLRADCVEPVHCLVLRGPERTIVRRWSADTRLNGRTFRESALQAGDRLSIGRLDLEVVETGQPETPAEARLAQQKSLEEQLVAIEARLRSLDEQQAECDTRQADLAVATRGMGRPSGRVGPAVRATASGNCSASTPNSKQCELFDVPAAGVESAT